MSEMGGLVGDSLFWRGYGLLAECGLSGANRGIVAGCPTSDQDDLFWRNAVRFYRL
jgi:hypothetical protein